MKEGEGRKGCLGWLCHNGVRECEGTDCEEYKNKKGSTAAFFVIKRKTRKRNL